VQARETLAKVYAANTPASEKLAQKRAVFAQMRADYDTAKAGEPGLAGFDRWFTADGGPNNASLAAIALYTARVPQFRALLAQEHGDLPRFYLRVKALAALPQAQRDASLDALAPAPPP
jgi:predicted aminopeptidase